MLFAYTFFVIPHKVLGSDIYTVDEVSTTLKIDQFMIYVNMVRRPVKVRELV